MRIIINVDNILIEKENLDLFIKEFKKQLKSGVQKGSYISEFLNFKWSIKL
jgi:hypothetical protein